MLVPTQFIGLVSGVRIMVFNVTFSNISDRGSQFYYWMKAEYLEKTTSLSKALSHNVVSSTPHLVGIRTHNVSGDRH